MEDSFIGHACCEVHSWAQERPLLALNLHPLGMTTLTLAEQSAKVTHDLFMQQEYG
jgi:hypothetical protein